VPEPGSSGGFNRYRYTRNNPLKYTDPSGHQECENEADCDRLTTKDVIDVLKESVKDVPLEIIRNGAPTTFGIEIDATFSWDMFAGPDYNLEAIGAYNWYSGEMGLILDADTGGSLGTPGGMAGNLSASAMISNGATSLDMFEGPSRVLYGEVSADSIAKTGMVANLGWALDENNQLAIDPVAGGPVLFGSVGGSVGVNGIPNGVEVRGGANLAQNNARVLNSRDDFVDFFDDVKSFISKFTR
jgi:uncharacterized protein RhaS with RHS repeats